ncbi:MAG: hypothetical protein QW350_00475 [Candidatus Aenigmatarchaeota archaeon]
MNGQISIEYMISFSIFLGIVTYIYLQYIGNITPFTEDVLKEEKRAEAYQIADILINDPGEPINWDTLTPKRVGLANESTNMTNWIKLSKINALPCDLLDKIFIQKPFNIMIFEVDPNTGARSILKTCISSNLRVDQINVTVTRYAIFDNGRIAELVVQV